MSIPSKNLNTLVDLLEWRADEYPEDTAYIFLADGETESTTLTYSQLKARAVACALALQERNAEGQPVIICMPSGIDFLPAYFGCLYAGAIPVPCYPPRRNRADSRLTGILEDTKAKLIVTCEKTHEDKDRFRKFNPILEGIEWIVSDTLSDESVSKWKKPTIDGSTLALLQYTSGSTSKPKGVMVNHSDLLNNLADLDVGWDHTAKSTMVTWLPIFHDMGLIYGVLQPIFSGCRCVLMPPASFIQRPVRWLKAVTRYGGTHSAAPNFAYDMCLKSVTDEDIKELDLSTWQVTLNAAEMVRSKTITAFIERFSKCGYKPKTMCPGFGLAEATLKISTNHRIEHYKTAYLDPQSLNDGKVVHWPKDKADGMSLVGCGLGSGDCVIKIVNPETLEECSPNQVGEIWASHNSIAQGYWNKPKETEETFHAKVKGQGDRNYMRTGDLGFIHEDDLYVCGRLKELVIIRGQNYYPYDIEAAAAESYDGLRQNGTAAFSVSVGDTEQLVLVQEVERSHHRTIDKDAAIQAIRSVVSRDFDLRLYGVVLVKPNAVPRTTSGKIQRQLCCRLYEDGELAEIARSEEAPAVEVKESKDLSIEEWIIEKIAAQSGMAVESINPQSSFSDCGLDSVEMTQLTGELEDWLKKPVLPTLVFDYPTIRQFAEQLNEDTQEISVTEDSQIGEEDSDIAIIGMQALLPGADNVDEFWQNLLEGKETVTTVPESRWDAKIYSQEGPNESHWGGFLSRVDEFDAEFFGLTPREAESMDPQQRLLMETSWLALESAGIRPTDIDGSKTGVFVGISNNDYARLQNGLKSACDAFAGTGNSFSIAANRLSYFYNFRGPSMAVDTACSSSLVAVHNASLALRRGECDLAMTAGVNLILTPHMHMAFEQAGMMSADGHCHTFDEKANGYVRSEGCAVIIMKRLSDAIADGDEIHAVIHGSAINQDGRSNGLTAPNGTAQQTLIRDALKSAACKAEDVSYVEAHGTGTPLGDPIEVEALKAVYRRSNEGKKPCYLGSVKANIGHLESAAGMAGLLKVVLALKNKTIPQQVNLENVNPLIKLSDSGIQFPLENVEWKSADDKYMAAVSSFGFGGTNSHVILGSAPEQAMPVAEKTSERPVQLLALSAKNAKSLNGLADVCIEELESGVDVADFCYSVNSLRSNFQNRLAVKGNSASELIESLKTHDYVDSKEGSNRSIKTAFIFTGQGSQYPAMAKVLYDAQPFFKEQIDYCAKILESEMDKPLLSLLYGDDSSKLNQTSYTQPALFAIEYCLASLWMSWGVKPDVVMGHSVGEFAAATIAGVFSLEDGLKLIAARGRLMQAQPPIGSMLVAFCSEDDALKAASKYKDVSIAAINGPKSVVLSGGKESISEIAAAFKQGKVSSQPLNVSHAFHSPLMEPMLNDFRKVASAVNFNEPKIDFISNVSGELAGGNVASADYWVDHIMQPVRFCKGMQSVVDLECDNAIEVGPNPVLIGMGQRCVDSDKLNWIPSIQQREDNWTTISTAATELFEGGVDIDWRAFEAPYARNRVSVPEYVFDRQRYWISESEPLQVQAPKLDTYTTEWISEPFNSTKIKKSAEQGYWLVLQDEKSAGSRYAEFLKREGIDSFVIALNEQHDYAGIQTAISNALSDSKDKCLGVSYFINRQETGRSKFAEIASLKNDKLLGIAQSFLAQEALKETRLWVISEGLIASEEQISGADMLAHGWAKAMLAEMPDNWGALIDLPSEFDKDKDWELFTQLYNESVSYSDEYIVSITEETRNLPRLSSIDSISVNDVSVDEEALYLVTGAYGTLGRHLTDVLIQKGAKHLIFISRNDQTELNQAYLTSLEGSGISITSFKGDVSSEGDVTRLFEKIDELKKPLRGIVHAAGVVESCLLNDMKPADMQSVCDAKVSGTYLLDQYSRELELDFFVCCSSLLSVIAYPGFSHYTIANQFMTSLMHERRKSGLSGISINWGPWENSGMVSDSLLTTLTRMGINGLNAGQALETFDRLLSSDLIEVTVASVDWEKYSEHCGARIRNTLVSPFTEKEQVVAKGSVGNLPDRQAFVSYMQNLLSSVTGKQITFGVDTGFFEMGVDSIMTVEMRNRINKDWQLSLRPSVLFECPSINKLADHILKANEDKSSISTNERQGSFDNEPIAIIGIGCRFPGSATSPDAFWEMLKNGEESVGAFPSERWNHSRIFDPDPEAKGKIYAKGGHFLDDILRFDSEFFNIPPREALSMDPQQRLLLEVSWQALESAGQTMKALDGSKTGVFIGIGQNDFAQLKLHGSSEDVSAYDGTGNGFCFATGRLSYFFGLQGPNFAVDTACSSSLVAIHQACMSLRNGESNLAISGGVQVMLSPAVSLFLSRAKALSADGRCKTFDQSADGFGRGEGCGVVILKRLSDARRDNDRVLAVIRGSAVNHDGPASGLTVPNGKAQQVLIESALQNAGLEGNDVQYIEAHGTGTSLGDPIELEAIDAALNKDRKPSDPLLVGSVKTNIGHLEAAAGVAGVIKSILSIQHGTFPAHLNFKTPNANVAWDELSLKIPTESTAWRNNSKRRRAGISGFGIAGTNAHVILEEAEELAPHADSKISEPVILTMSAKSEAALKRIQANMIDHLESSPDQLQDICYSANIGRTDFDIRVAVIAETKDQLVEEIRSLKYEDYSDCSKGQALEEVEDFEHASENLKRIKDAYLSGTTIDWNAFYAEGGYQRVDLPSYPFMGERFPLGNKISYSPVEPTWEVRELSSAEQATKIEHWVLCGSYSPIVESVADEFLKRAIPYTNVASIDAVNDLVKKQQDGSCGILLFESDSAEVDSTSIARRVVEISELCHQLNSNAETVASVRVITTGVETEDHIAQAPITGLCRALTVEFPDLFAGQIDCSVSESAAKAIVDELLYAKAESIVSIKGSERSVLRLKMQSAELEQATAIDANGTYLISGGSGHLGVKTANSLLESGAKSLVLLSRRSPDKDLLDLIEDFRCRGCEVKSYQADVSDYDSLSKVWDTIKSECTPLKGIFHAAGVVGYDAIEELTAEKCEAVFAAKVQGSWNLHRLSEKEDLDHFVCFSSIASVWGGKNQAHYSVANSFMDALMKLRHSSGLAGLSINWGPWSGGGMATQEFLEGMKVLGISALDADVAMQTLTNLLGFKSSQAVVANIDWDSFGAVYNSQTGSSLLEYLISSKTVETENDHLAQARSVLLKIPAAERKDHLVKCISDITANILGYKSSDDIDPETGFFDLGMDSMMSVELRNRIIRELHIDLPTTATFDHGSVLLLTNHLLRLAEDDAGKSTVEVQSSADLSEGIAIIGMGCRFPGSVDNAESYWNLLSEGRDAVVPVPQDRWDMSRYYDPEPETGGKMYAHSGGFLNQIDQFDPGFFGISGKEALSMDPQQRMLLEVSWEAFENAGIVPKDLTGSMTGVFVGVTSSDYAQYLMSVTSDKSLDAYFATGNVLNAISGRLAYTFGFHGPCMSIDTACSSSLVAVHNACQSLRNQECNMAVAAGVNLMLLPDVSISLSQARVLAPDGRCKTFDDSADGYGRGEGCGAVILKRLSDAIRDKDEVLAVLKGSAINHCGPGSGLTVPNGQSQQQLIKQALKQANLKPADIDYLEAHGTGTSLGDPIEIQAAAEVFGQERDDNNPLKVGSVKTNLGHLESAAGMAGLMKVVLSIQNKSLPKHLHLSKPNTHIDWDKLNVSVVTENDDWGSNDALRRAGVSSFGFSGTNAHVVLEEMPLLVAEPQSCDRPIHVFTCSAMSLESLTAQLEKYSDFLKETSNTLADICHAVNTQRTHFKYRVAYAVTSLDELRQKLNEATKNGVSQAELTDKNLSIAFTSDKTSENAELFYIGEDCDWESLCHKLSEHYQQGADIDWKQFDESYSFAKLNLPNYAFNRKRYWIDAKESDEGETIGLEDWIYDVEWQKAEQGGRNTKPDFLPEPKQLFDNLKPFLTELEQKEELVSYWNEVQEIEERVVGYIAKALQDLGWTLNEGREFSLNEIKQELGIVKEHQQLFARILEILGEAGVLSGNSTQWKVIKSPTASIDSLSEDPKYQYAAKEYALLKRCCEQLPDVLLNKCNPLELLFPENDDITAAHIYADAAGAQVMNDLVSKNLSEMIRDLPEGRPLRILEVGAGTGATSAVVLPLLDPERTEYCFTDISPTLVQQAGKRFAEYDFVKYQVLDLENDLLAQGLEVEQFDIVIAVNVLHATSDLTRCLSLLNRVMQKNALMLAVEGTESLRFIDMIFGLTEGWWRFTDKELRPSHALLTKDSWLSLFNNCGFTQTEAVGAEKANSGVLSQQSVFVTRKDHHIAGLEEAESTKRLIISDQNGVGAALSGLFKEDGAEAELMDSSDETALVSRLEKNGGALKDIVFLPAINHLHDDALTVDELMTVQKGICSDLLNVIHSLQKSLISKYPRLWVVTAAASSSVNKPQLNGLVQSALRGFSKTIGMEFPELKCSYVDLEESSSKDSSLEYARRLHAEILRSDNELDVALAANAERRVARLLRSDCSDFKNAPLSFKTDASYLITGGLGGLGLEVADWMIERGAKNIALLGRSSANVEAKQRIEELEASGAKISILQGDVSKIDDLDKVFSDVSEKLPPLRGVIHAAGALSDAMLAQMNWERFEAVFKAKVAGSWNLHQLTKDLSLDHFVLFSSTTAMLGTPGQANHAGANTFVDALAAYRRSRGLKALSINWGAWSQVGAAARKGFDELIKAKGIGVIAPKEGIKILEQLMSGNESRVQTAVIPIDWKRFRSEVSDKPFYSICVDEVKEASTEADSIAEHYQLSESINTREGLIKHISSIAAEILGMRADERIDTETGLFEMGMDSLMSVNFRNKLQGTVDCNVPSTIVFDYPTIEEMCDFLLTEMSESTGSENNVASDEVSFDADDLASVDDLSDEEIDAMIDRQLEGSNS